jgi:hypothetical protein
MTSPFQKTIDKLCEVSRRKPVDPYTELEWPETIESGQWFTSPELISLHGTHAWERMDDAARSRLSFLEAVNFCSLNVHGEKALVEGLTRRLYDQSDPTWIGSSPYLHHFIDEENKHMVYFGGFCRRYAGKVYRDRKISLARKYAPGEEDFLFFARVLIFENIVDVHNQRMSNDERLAPIARRINLLHHLEETRHLVFGRQIVRELFEQHSPAWSRETLVGVQSYLAAYLATTWREYTNPDVYADAGFDEPYDFAENVFQDEHSRARRREMSSGCVRFLLEHGMLAAEPEL